MSGGYSKRGTAHVNRIHADMQRGVADYRTERAARDEPIIAARKARYAKVDAAIAERMANPKFPRESLGDATHIDRGLGWERIKRRGAKRLTVEGTYPGVTHAVLYGEVLRIKTKEGER